MEDINKTLDEAIRKKDIIVIRDILTTSMVQDPGFSDGVFEERLKRCRDGGLSEKEIFVPFEGKPINDNRDAWTDNYYAEQRTEFRYNFSRERLEHLKKVGRKLFPSTIPIVPPDQEKEEESHERERTYRPEPDYGEKNELPRWVLPLGIAAVVFFLLWLLFRRR